MEQVDHMRRELAAAKAKAATAEARLGAETSNVSMLQEQVARLERIASDSVQQVVEPLQRQKEAAEHEALELARQLRLFEDERAQLEAEVMQQKRAMRELQAETKRVLARGVTDASFADTFEEVMQEEFAALRAAYEAKLEAQKEKSAALERDRRTEVARLLDDRRQERLVYEVKLGKLRAELALSSSSGAGAS